jgi:hypothetical protein
MSQFKKYLEIIQEGKLSALELGKTKGQYVFIYGGEVYTSNEEIKKTDTIGEAVNKFKSSLDNKSDTLIVNYNDNTLSFAASAKEVRPSQLNFVKYHADLVVVGAQGEGRFQYKKI